MYEIKSVNHNVQIEPSKSESGKGKMNGIEYSADVQKIDDNNYHIIKNNRSYSVEIVTADYKEKKFVVKVNNSQYEFEVKDKFDLLLKELGMESLKNVKINELKAPMPGLVVNVLVQPGDVVAKGDGLVVLEAMKMENILKSPDDVVIKSIEIEKSQTVEKNQLLIKFE
jgi:biotin carboxyl carrier protein